MNIKEQILKCVYSTPSKRDFAFSESSPESRERFQDSVADFLKAVKHDETEDRCREVYFSMLDLHDKYPILFPPIDRLNVDELYGMDARACGGQRLHFSHQANVFLLGLYIYHNFEPLRIQMDREMTETTVEIPREPPYSPFRYSGGDQYGEFLYRWRLSSLCHDIGTGIHLCRGEENKIAGTLKRFRFQKPISSIRELYLFEGHDLLANLDNACGIIKFSQYTQYQEAHPFPDNIHHDHGIMGGLVFLQLMYGAYSRHQENQISRNVDGMEVFWHPEILSHSIIQIAMSIAMHNLDKYPQALQNFSSTAKVFDIQRCPLAWLLKITDLIQEWDKPKIGMEQAEQDASTDLALAFSDSKIFVSNFPKEKKEETLEVIRSFTWPNDIISLV